MALTVSLTYTVTERTLPDGSYAIILTRSDGLQLHRSGGLTRQLAIQGLHDFGFTVTDDQQA